MISHFCQNLTLLDSDVSQLHSVRETKFICNMILRDPQLTPGSYLCTSYIYIQMELFYIHTKSWSCGERKRGD